MAEPHRTELPDVLPLTRTLAASTVSEIAEVEADCMATNGLFGTASGERATRPESYRTYMSWAHEDQWDDESGRVAYCFYVTPDAPTTGSLVAGTSPLLPQPGQS